MRIRAIFTLAIVSCIVLLASCGGFEKVKRSNDVNYKLTMANTYFDKKDYLKARELYEGLMPVMKGTRNFEPMFYKYAMSLFQLKDYLSASYYFKNYTASFPNSANADEAAYLHAYSLYKMSPKGTVEQTNTIKAMEALQSYVNAHPDSKHLDEANKFIAQTHQKLESKAVAAAKLYYDISQYRAAAISYQSVITDYPDSGNMDEYQYMIVKAYYHFAKGSEISKQKERYVSVLNAYQELVDNFPKSKYLQDAEKYFTLAATNIKKIKNEHQ